MDSFLSIERWPRQRAATDREVWTRRLQQTAGEGRELGERRANKETNKQRARQTKGPSAGDRQTSGKKPTERPWSACPRLGNMRRALSVPSVRVSAGISGAACPLRLHIHFPGCFCSPYPVPSPSISLTVPSQLLFLSQASSCPALHAPSQGDSGSSCGPWEATTGTGQSSRDEQEGQGLQLWGQCPSLQKGKERAVGIVSPGLVRLGH